MIIMERNTVPSSIACAALSIPPLRYATTAATVAVRVIKRHAGRKAKPMMKSTMPKVPASVPIKPQNGSQKLMPTAFIAPPSSRHSPIPPASFFHP
jgi:hypothetical protein